MSRLNQHITNLWRCFECLVMVPVFVMFDAGRPRCVVRYVLAPTIADRSLCLATGS